MADRPRCPQCGADRGSQVRVGGLCPACLLQLALAPRVEEADDEAEEADLLVQDREYRVVTILDADSSGTTYLAEQARPRRLVTLHVVALGHPLDAGSLAAFRARVAALGRLAHPAIQPFVEARRTRDHAGCVVSVYIHGRQLARAVASFAMDGDARARLFTTICGALSHAHRQGVTHGRLGPQAIVVRQDAAGVAQPVVVGFSVFAGPVPDIAADLDGLVAIARTLGWSGGLERTASSADELREAVERSFLARA